MNRFGTAMAFLHAGAALTLYLRGEILTSILLGVFAIFWAVVWK